MVDICRTVGKVGNTVAASKAMYDTYADKKCKTVGGKIAYMAGTLAAGYAMGKAAQWGAGKLKNLGSKMLPRMKSAIQEGASKLISRMNSRSGGRSKTIASGKTYYHITTEKMHRKLLNLESWE